MSVFIKHYKGTNLPFICNNKLWRYSSTAADIPLKKDDEEEEFRVLDILKKRQRTQRRTLKRTDVQPDRTDRMPVDQVIVEKYRPETLFSSY